MKFTTGSAVPKLNLQDGFSASFKVKISSETSLSADAFAVLWDPIPNKPEQIITVAMKKDSQLNLTPMC